MPLDFYRGDEEELDRGHGEVLGPDGSHGWPSAEGLGLASPADLWTTPAVLES
jgi:hypothetical protein